MAGDVEKARVTRRAVEFACGCKTLVRVVTKKTADVDDGQAVETGVGLAHDPGLYVLRFGGRSSRRIRLRGQVRLRFGLQAATCLTSGKKRRDVTSLLTPHPRVDLPQIGHRRIRERQR